MNFKVLKNFYYGMKQFGENIALIINSILLFIVYFIGVGITKIFALLAGNKRIKVLLRAKESYWTPYKMGESFDSYYRQF